MDQYEKCKHCGEDIEAQDVFMDGTRGRWRHADYPRALHCVMNFTSKGTQLYLQSAEPEDRGY